MPKLILFKIIKMRQILSKFSVWGWDLIIRIALSRCTHKMIFFCDGNTFYVLSLWQTIIFTPFGNSDSRTKFCLAQILIQNGHKNQIPNVSNFKQNFVTQICLQNLDFQFVLKFVQRCFLFSQISYFMHSNLTWNLELFPRKLMPNLMSQLFWV